MNEVKDPDNRFGNETLFVSLLFGALSIILVIALFVSKILFSNNQNLSLTVANAFIALIILYFLSLAIVSSLKIMRKFKKSMKNNDSLFEQIDLYKSSNINDGYLIKIIDSYYKETGKVDELLKQPGGMERLLFRSIEIRNRLETSNSEKQVSFLFFPLVIGLLLGYLDLSTDVRVLNNWLLIGIFFISILLAIISCTGEYNSQNAILRYELGWIDKKIELIRGQNTCETDLGLSLFRQILYIALKTKTCLRRRKRRAKDDLLKQLESEDVDVMTLYESICSEFKGLKQGIDKKLKYYGIWEF